MTPMIRGSSMVRTQRDGGIVTHPFRKERRIMVIRSEMRVSKSLPQWIDHIEVYCVAQRRASDVILGVERHISRSLVQIQP